jgi:hypothetical protein
MTEIAPGMMVECLKDFPKAGAIKGSKYFVLALDNERRCAAGHSNCCGLFLSGMRSPFEVIPAYKNFPNVGWAQCSFKPIGGDKEIEKEESKRTGKSAEGDIRNSDYREIKFFIIDMDDK